MLVSYDTDAAATCVRVADATVAVTVEISDLAMVDLDEVGQPVGVEFLVPPRDISPEMLVCVADRFAAIIGVDPRPMDGFAYSGERGAPACFPRQ